MFSKQYKSQQVTDAAINPIYDWLLVGTMSSTVHLFIYYLLTLYLEMEKLHNSAKNLQSNLYQLIVIVVVVVVVVVN